MPFVLAIGLFVLYCKGLQGSISGYYHTEMRDVFVGTLCAIGVFMLSYRGYERNDRIAGNFASAFAIVTALFPTTPDLNPTQLDKVKGAIHLEEFKPVFWLESIAVLAFGISWLTKGETILKDQT